MAKKNDRLGEALAWYKRSLEDADAARENLHQAIADTVASGELTRAEVARRLGWPRQRVTTVLKGWEI